MRALHPQGGGFRPLKLLSRVSGEMGRLAALGLVGRDLAGPRGPVGAGPARVRRDLGCSLGCRCCVGPKAQHGCPAVGESRFEVGDGDVVKQNFGGIAQAVVDEADVGTPALVADDGIELGLACLRLGQTNYSASKAGLIGFTKALAREVASRLITVNAVAPGFIPTSLTNDLSEELKKSILGATPIGRMGKPEEIASAVAFLASEEAAYITGQVLAVDGGMAMM